MTTWKELNIQSQLLNNLMEYEWKQPTKVQQLVISKINRNCDILIQSHTGSGKTGAFLIPIINRLSYVKQVAYNPLVLILSPTRELAQQTQEVFEKLSKNMNIQAVLLTGGIPVEKQLRNLQLHPQVLIATPGRVADLLSNNQLSLDQIQILVIDEADKLIQLNYVSEIHAIVQQLPFKKQTIFASATLNEEALKLSDFVLVKPIRVNLEDGVIANQNIDQQWVFTNDKNIKLAQIASLISQNMDSKIVIFVSSKTTLLKLQAELNVIFDHQIGFYILSSQYSQQERNNTVEMFNRERQAILISTDLGSRGIDFKDVQVVINYEMVKEPEQYIHRIGRCARYQNKGVSITICEKQQAKQLINQLQKIGQLGQLKERVIREQILQEQLKIVKDSKFSQLVKEEQANIEEQRHEIITDRLLERHENKQDIVKNINTEYIVDQNQKKVIQDVIKKAHQGQLSQKEATELLKQRNIKNSLRKLRNGDEKALRNNKNTQVSKQQKQAIHKLKRENRQKKIDEFVQEKEPELLYDADDLIVERKSVQVTQPKSKEYYDIVDGIEMTVINRAQELEENYENNSRFCCKQGDDYINIHNTIQFNYFNLEFQKYMPEQLENQFKFRFTQKFNTSEEMSVPNENTILDVVFIEKEEDKKEKQIQLYKKQNSSQDFIYLKLKVNQQFLEQQFLKYQDLHCVRGLSLQDISITKNIIILHDFYQTPLNLIPIMNILYEKNINVFVPYIMDLMEDKEVTDYNISIKMLKEYIYRVLGKQTQYIIISEGFSSNIALIIQKKDKNCKKCILLNPLQEIYISTGQKRKASLIKQQMQSLTLSTEDEEETTSSEDYYKDQSAIQKILSSDPQSSEIAIGVSQQQKSVIKNQQINRIQSSSFGQFKSNDLEKLDIPNNEKLITTEYVRNAEQEKILLYNYQDDDSYQLANIELSYIYDDTTLQVISNILQLKSKYEITLNTEIKYYYNLINSCHTQKQMREQLYKSLFYHYVFATPDCFITYNKYQNIFNNYYFKRLYNFSKITENYEFDQSQSLDIIISSNSTLLTIRQLKKFYELSDYYPNVKIKTLVAAGQDILFAFINQLDGLLIPQSKNKM